MRRLLITFAVVVLACLGTAIVTFVATRPAPAKTPDTPAVLTQLREVARLETLDLTLYKKIDFTPDPPPSADSTWKDVVSWASFNLRNPHGRAILFAVVHLGLDAEKLDAEHVRAIGDRVWVVLPPVVAQVELQPGQTEIIDSNLDSADTARLLEAAKGAFQREVLADPRLREKARASNERALRGLLASVGFREVLFVPQLPGANGT